MQLPTSEVNVRDLETRIENALRDKAGHIFFDTSFLTWLYRISGAARAEFVSWVADPSFQDRLHIPCWCLHELSRHLRSKEENVFFPHRQFVANAIDVVGQMSDIGKLLVDEEWLKGRGFADRDDYLAQLEKNIAETTKLFRVLNDKPELRLIHDELLPVLNKLTLSSDVFSLVENLQSKYAARAEGRMPPGFEDRNKKGNTTQPETYSGANRFGDLVAWTEALETAQAKSAKFIVIVTHDLKSDWVHIPDRIKDRGGHSRPNPTDRRQRVFIPAPLLIHEAKSKAKVEDLFVIDAARLVYVLAVLMQVPLKSLSAAVQTEIPPPASPDITPNSQPSPPQESVREVANIEPVQLPAATEVEKQIDDAPQAVAPSEQTSISSEQKRAIELGRGALADAYYVGGGNLDLDHSITELKSHNWYTQNPAMARVRIILAHSTDLRPDQLFVLGRNIYQAACGAADEAQRFMSKLSYELKDISDDLANIIVAGMFHEVYFDSHGNLRERPKAAGIDQLFVVQNYSRFSVALKHIQDSIGEKSTNYIVLPQNPMPQIRLDFQLTPGQPLSLLAGIQFQGQQLLEEAGDNFARSLEWIMHGPKRDIEAVLLAFGNYFCVPQSQLGTNMEFNTPLRISENSAFIDWGPFTEVTFRNASQIRRTMPTGGDE